MNRTLLLRARTACRSTGYSFKSLLIGGDHFVILSPISIVYEDIFLRCAISAAFDSGDAFRERRRVKCRVESEQRQVRRRTEFYSKEDCFSPRIPRIITRFKGRVCLGLPSGFAQLTAFSPIRAEIEKYRDHDRRAASRRISKADVRELAVFPIVSASRKRIRGRGVYLRGTLRGVIEV